MSFLQTAVRFAVLVLPALLMAVAGENPARWASAAEPEKVSLPPAPPPPPAAPGEAFKKLPPAPPPPATSGEAFKKLPPAPPPPPAVPGEASKKLPPAPPPPPAVSGEASKKLPPAPPPPPVTLPSRSEKPAPLTSTGKPPATKRMADDENSCIQCHANLTEKDQVRFLVTAKDFAGDAHWQKGLRCQDCHGGDATVFEIKAHQASGDFRVPKSAEEMRKFCGTCHQAEALELVKGVHDKAGPKNELGHGTPLACGGCHGTPSHRILPARDSRSPVFLDHQVNTCGACHEDRLETYRDSVHGQGLSRMGLLVVPACADCHGAHGVYRAPDKRSSLHPSRVAATCGKCHRFIEERLAASVHGQVPGGAAEKVAPGGSGKQKPSCTACHQGHDLPAPETAAFRRQLPNRCGNCHAKLSSRYALSIHGELTELGYSPAAKCSDCHGAHDIRLVSDPHSRLAADNRLQTCQQCHAHAPARFVSFDPHADYRDAQRDPLVHGVYVVLLTILLSTFGLFGLHAVLWFVRGLVEVLKTGRPRGLDPARPAYVRFSMVHRVGHSFLLVAFLGLALTGLPLKYSHAPWAKVVAQAWGGFASTGFWHRVFALVVFGCFASYMVRLVRQFLAGRRRGESLLDVVFGPDSPVPNFRDLRDCFAMLRWFLGLGPKPGFERWAYWEKLDFWGAAADIVIIGFTGLVLWFPNFFCRFLPGRVLNIAQVVHSTQALLATGFVFAIHFFNTHLRPDKFPADMSVMTGRISEDEFRDERPAFFDRLRRQGGLEAIRATSPGYKALWLIRALGMLAMVAGLALLAGMVAAGLSD